MKKSFIYASVTIIVAVLAFDFVESQNSPERGYFFSIFAKKAVVSDSARVVGPFVLGNKLAVGALVALVDSFATTAATDTVTISGASSNDLYLVTPKYNGILADTVPYNVRSISTGAIVTRAASGRQSGANYVLFRVVR